MKRFTTGPIEMEKEILEIRGMQLPYHKDEEFSHIMLETDVLLKKFVKAPVGAKTVYLTATGTAALEATVINVFTPADKVLIIDGGTFEHRFIEICRVHDIPHVILKLKPGEALTAEHLEAFEGEALTGFLVNLNETSTEQLYDIKLISAFCKRKNCYLIVDAISTFLCNPYDMEGFGADATIISSQKGLGISPGLSIVVLNERIIKDRIMTNPTKSFYFNFKYYIRGWEKGKLPFTPCVGICMQLNKALKLIEAKGLALHLAGIRVVAEDFRHRLAQLPLKLPDYPLSNGVTPVIFPDDNAMEMFYLLKENYDIVVTQAQGDWKNKVLMIAHIGNVSVDDNEVLIKAMKEILHIG